MTRNPALAAESKGLGLLVAASLLWSSSGIFIKVLSLSAFQISFHRSLVAAAAIVLFQTLRGRPWSLPRDPLSIGGSLVYAFVLVGFVSATKLTTAANAIFLQYAAPIYLLFLEPLVFRKPFQARDSLAVAACVGGMALFFAGHLERGGLLGNALALLSGLLLALFSLLLKWKRVKAPDHDPIGMVILGNLFTAAVCLPFVAPRFAVGGREALVLLYLGAFQLGLAYMLFNAGMRYLSATAALITCMLEAVFNPVWVFLGIGERPAPQALAGGTIILAVILWYNLRKAPVPGPVD
ncbi:DMT family transporter [Mesoterricola sediminis]|uniref:Membrane protein n=1 Tax=Mesoterricola sediminis TaxID=2927980 RepID=A0AA48GSH2_9BACT|nr:DMT family transporter [Mesoterricola sediminis]BDU76824.1 membrane protein [Mesoterricola sediminis]